MRPWQLTKTTVGKVPLIFASGGRPVTIHADSRYQVSEIIKKTNALAAVDGGFFSLEYLDSNVMVGPVFSQSSGKFTPGNVKEIRRIQGRPLVLISPTEVKYIPFDPAKHNDLAGLKAELPHLTDAFVAAAWLVRDGQPQPAANFGNLFDFDAARDRAYWGIDPGGTNGGRGFRRLCGLDCAGRGAQSGGATRCGDGRFGRKRFAGLSGAVPDEL